MLEIVYGQDWKVLSRCARKRITADAEQGMGGRVLIVPEQHSFESEQALCEEGGDRISRFAEVLSFSRLAERSCNSCGGAARPVLDQGGRIMALARTVSNVRPRLQFYARSARRADFLLQMLSIVDELKSYRVDSSTLSKASEHLEGSLAVKTQELALLLEGYEALCANAGPDPRDRLEQLLDHILLNGFGQDLRLYVDGFPGFSAQELQILAAFLKQGTELTVFLCCDDPFDGEQVFSCTRATARDLIREADRCGARVCLTRMDQSLSPLGSSVLSTFTRQAAPDSGCLRLYQCAGAQDEAEAICSDILQHIRKGGRFRDISVACASPEEMRPILEAEFERCHIPAFFAGRQPALRTSLMSSTLYALRAAGGRMEREDVIAYLRSDGSPVTQEECDLLESYAFIWNISGDLWNNKWAWHPRGLDNDMEQADLQTLETLNALRVRCIGPLQRLRGSLRECVTIGDCVIAFDAFLRDTQFSDNVKAHLEMLEHSGEVQQLQVTRQLYDLLVNALEQLYGVQCDVQCTTEEFLRLMEILLGQYQVGAIPAVLDAVTVGDTRQLEYKQTRIMFLCGCNDGSFPQPVAGGSLLTEPERRLLRKAGIGVALDENEQMDRNILGAYSVMCAAEEKLIISAGEQSAWLFTTLCNLYPDAVSQYSESPSTAYATEQTLGLHLAKGGYLQDVPQAAASYCRRLQEAAKYDFGPLREQTVEALYGSMIYLSASRIDRFATCRFHFFLNDGLKARERREASFDAATYGTMVHSVLEHAVSQVMDEGGFRNVTRARMQLLVKACLDRYLSENVDPIMLSSERSSYLMTRNTDEILRVADVLYDELSQSSFEPVDFELTFRNGGALPPVPVDSGSGGAIVSGAVDRVDMAEIGGQKYFRVVDYKTGRKDFDYTDILERRGLQMLIYMFALERFGAERYGISIQPAGVLYVPAHDDMTRLQTRPEEDGKAVEKKMKNHRRQGLLLNNASVLQAMEPCGDEQPVFLPCKNGKNGLSGYLMDGKQLTQLRHYVESALRSVTEEIRSGNVRPNPYTRGSFGSCTWCPYASICHLDLCSNEQRSLSSTNEKEFWSRLAEKEAKYG